MSMKKSLALLSIIISIVFINSINTYALPKVEFDEEKSKECILHIPKQTQTNNFFQEINAKSKDKTETFASILHFFEQNKRSYYLFTFNYPLANKKHAEKFEKVLAIKAQEANRFVPVIESSQFIEPCHLGFIRQIRIKDGPTVQERVLVDQKTKKVIFIEDWVDIGNQIVPGNFAAVNAVIEKNAQWFFTGDYLYEVNPEDTEESIIEMFKKTYENMLTFLENEDVEVVYSQLHSY